MWKIELKMEIFDNLYTYLMEEIIFLNKKNLKSLFSCRYKFCLFQTKNEKLYLAFFSFWKWDLQFKLPWKEFKEILIELNVFNSN